MRTSALVLAVCVLSGCAVSRRHTAAEYGWGPGVSDPFALREKVIGILETERKKPMLDRHDFNAALVLKTMTWEQGCEVYRNSSAYFRGFMNPLLINEQEASRYQGLPRLVLVNTLGRPDSISEDGAYYYTGEIPGPDGPAGAFFRFDDEDRVVHIGYVESGPPPEPDAEPDAGEGG